MWKKILSTKDFNVGDRVRQIYSRESNGKENCSDEHIIIKIENGFVLMDKHKQSSLTAMTNGEFNYEVFVAK